MPDNLTAIFESFASLFIREYWVTIKENRFPMPPDEPVEESLDALLSAVSFTTQQKAMERTIKMINSHGDWWSFGFNRCGSFWKISSASVRADKKKNSHDLLGPVFEKHFRPFLEHVTSKANNVE